MRFAGLKAGVQSGSDLHQLMNIVLQNHLISSTHRTVHCRVQSRQDEGGLISDSGKRKKTVLKQDGVTVDLSSHEGHGKIHAGVLDDQFVLSADKVTELQDQFGMTIDELLVAMISPASAMARPPISSFHVGAAGIGGSGKLYVGCNLEFANLPLYNAVHAEQFLLVNALHNKETSIKKIAISAAPCGHCRQFFSELACADSIKFLFFGGAYSLGQLLPMRFKPADLLQDSNVPLLLLPQDNRVEFTSDAKEQIESWRARDRLDLVQAAEEALRECMNAYSPYSKCPSGAAIVTHEGGIYSGGYIESAAYNPSMVPLQTAIVDAVIDGMPSYSTLKAALLVELKHGAVQHSKSMGVNVSQIAPDAEFKVLYVKWAT